MMAAGSAIEIVEQVVQDKVCKSNNEMLQIVFNMIFAIMLRFCICNPLFWLYR